MTDKEARITATLPQPLRRKVEAAVAMLQKAERLALQYDSEGGYWLAFSGGKDSQALYHIAKLANVRFHAVMSLTSVDPPEVIRFVRKHYPDCEMIKPQMSMYRAAVSVGTLPTRVMRWCCAKYKETAGRGKVTLIGIRAQESSRRARRHEVETTNRKFGGSLDDFEKWSEERKAEKAQKLAKRKINDDEFSVRSDNEIHCISGKESILISPLFTWSEADVWQFLNAFSLPHCELYDCGYKRIGCILCPMQGKADARRDVERYPHQRHKWLQALQEIIENGGYEKVTRLFPDVTDTARLAEIVFDWWRSRKNIAAWHSDRYRQLRFDFTGEQPDDSPRASRVSEKNDK